MPKPVQVGTDAHSDRYTWANLFVVVPRENPDADSMRASVDDMRTFLQGQSEGCGLVILIEAGAKLLDRAMIQELTGSIHELEGQLRGLVICIEAPGFMQAVVPMAGVLMRKSSGAYPRNLTKSVEETADWLAPHLELDGAPVEPSALREALVTMRDQTVAARDA